jgi:Xaa-Pro aminopeptidase
LARTFVINPSKEHTEAYSLMVDCYLAALKAMRPGAKLSSAYEAAVATVNAKKPAFLNHLTKNVGFGVRVPSSPPLALSTPPLTCDCSLTPTDWFGVP